MFKPVKILDEKDKRLRSVSEDVVFPLSNKEKELINDMVKHLTYSQIEKYSEKYNLRPGMGLAFPQVGINKRVIVIVDEYDEGKFEDYVVVNPVIVSNSREFNNYVLINPKMISHSEELIYASEGEGCLSVNRDVDGHVLRYARVTVEGYDVDGNKIRVRAREDLSIAFQHEIDHLNGILFFDRIDKNKRFYSEKEVRLI